MGNVYRRGKLSGHVRGKMYGDFPVGMLRECLGGPNCLGGNVPENVCGMFGDFLGKCMRDCRGEMFGDFLGLSLIHI